MRSVAARSAWDFPVRARSRTVDLTAAQRDRAVGAVIGMATGDALGAGYEFQPPNPPDRIAMIGGGIGTFEPGSGPTTRRWRFRSWRPWPEVTICSIPPFRIGWPSSGSIGPAARRISG